MLPVTMCELRTECCSDNQTRFMQQRITEVEKHFRDMCDGFGGYARGFAKLRDKGKSGRTISPV